MVGYCLPISYPQQSLNEPEISLDSPSSIPYSEGVTVPQWYQWTETNDGGLMDGIFNDGARGTYWVTCGDLGLDQP